MKSSLGKKSAVPKKKHPIPEGSTADAVATATPASKAPLGGPVAYPLGSLVRVPPIPPQTAWRLGVLRFTGTTDFARGDWAGVELVDAPGRNNGDVKGRRYFSCSPGRGIFVRANLLAPYVEDEQKEGAGGKEVRDPGDAEQAHSPNAPPPLEETPNLSRDAPTTALTAMEGENEPATGDLTGPLRRSLERENGTQLFNAVEGADSTLAPEQDEACAVSPLSLLDPTKRSQQGEGVKALGHTNVSTTQVAFAVEGDDAPLLVPTADQELRILQPADENNLLRLELHTEGNTEIECMEADNVKTGSSESSGVLFDDQGDARGLVLGDSRKAPTSSEPSPVVQTMAVVSELEGCGITSLVASEPAVDITKANESFQKLPLREHIENSKVEVSSLRENLCIQCRENEKIQQVCGAIMLRTETLGKALGKMQAGASNDICDLPYQTHDIISALTRERDELKEICDLQESELIKEKEQSDELSRVLNTVSEAHTRAVAEWAKVKATLEAQLQDLTQRLEEAELLKPQDDAGARSSEFDVALHHAEPEAQTQQDGSNHRVQELSRQLDASGLLVLQLRKEKEATKELRRRGDVLRSELEETLQAQKQREKEIIHSYEVALQQLRSIKDKTQAECISLRQKLEEVRVKEQGVKVDSSQKFFSCTIPLTKWERDEYEIIIRRQQRVIWSLQKKRFFPSLYPSIGLAGATDPKNMGTENAFATINKLSDTNRLVRELQEEVKYIKQSVYFSSLLLSKPGPGPAAAMVKPAGCILDFSTEQTRKQSVRRMFGCSTQT